MILGLERWTPTRIMLTRMGCAMQRRYGRSPCQLRTQSTKKKPIGRSVGERAPRRASLHGIDAAAVASTRSRRTVCGQLVVERPSSLNHRVTQHGAPSAATNVAGSVTLRDCAQSSRETGSAVGEHRWRIKAPERQASPPLLLHTESEYGQMLLRLFSTSQSWVGV